MNTQDSYRRNGHALALSVTVCAMVYISVIAAFPSSPLGSIAVATSRGSNLCSTRHPSSSRPQMSKHRLASLRTFAGMRLHAAPTGKPAETLNEGDSIVVMGILDPIGRELVDKLQKENKYKITTLLNPNMVGPFRNRYPTVNAIDATQQEAARTALNDAAAVVADYNLYAIITCHYYTSLSMQL
eukprot:jgi/Bigna1/61106/fgenesh1_kg.18_\